MPDRYSEADKQIKEVNQSNEKRSVKNRSKSEKLVYDEVVDDIAFTHQFFSDAITHGLYYTDPVGDTYLFSDNFYICFSHKCLNF